MGPFTISGYTDERLDYDTFTITYEGWLFTENDRIKKTNSLDLTSYLALVRGAELSALYQCESFSVISSNAQIVENTTTSSGGKISTYYTPVVTLNSKIFPSVNVGTYKTRELLSVAYSKGKSYQLTKETLAYLGVSPDKGKVSQKHQKKPSELPSTEVAQAQIKISKKISKNTTAKRSASNAYRAQSQKKRVLPKSTISSPAPFKIIE